MERLGDNIIIGISRTIRLSIGFALLFYFLDYPAYKVFWLTFAASGLTETFLDIVISGIKPSEAQNEK